jgi:hypothetical protein
MSLQNRYADAYLVAQTVNGTGQTVKLVGFLFAALVTVAGLMAASKMGAAVGFAGLFLGILVALPFYALGVLVSAQGQILKATLDTAVNTSPILSRDEIYYILVGSPAPALQASAETQSSQVPPRPIETTDIASPSSSPLLAQSAAKRSCPHCGGTLELGATRCRWCMNKV